MLENCIMQANQLASCIHPASMKPRLFPPILIHMDKLLFGWGHSLRARTGQAARRICSNYQRLGFMSEPVAKKPRKMPENVHESKLENGSSNGCETNGLNPSKLKCELNGTVENGGNDVDSEKSHADNSVLLCKRLSDDATLPTRGSSSAAGFDLYSACDVIVGKKDKEMVPTQIAITVPLGSYGRIAPRSGLAKNNFIDVGAGVIDHDYTGEVKVLLFNFSNKDFEVKKGNRIAQLVIEKIYMPELKEVEDLSKTKRGATGFGASGK